MSKIRRAMIMGAGLGIRMRPLTDDRPKPLLSVAGRTLIDRTIDRLVEAHVSLAVINLHYKGGMLKSHLRSRNDIDIRYSDESNMLLDTGGGVVKALSHFDGEPFFILNSDSIWIEEQDSTLCMMQNHFDERRMDGLLLLADMASALGYEGKGDFILQQDGRLERAKDHQGLPHAYPGVQIVHPRLFADPPNGAFSTNLMWDRAIAAKRLFGVTLEGVWIHVGTPLALEDAEKYLAATLSA